MTHEHSKDRALFSFPPPPPGANPSDYYQLMASASQRSPYGELLMQNGAAAAAVAAAAHLPDYISPVDGEDKAGCVSASASWTAPPGAGPVHLEQKL